MAAANLWRQAEAKDILEFVVLGPCLSEIHPSGISLPVGWHPEVNCHLLLLWLGHWHARWSWIRDKSFPKYMDDSCWVTGVWLQQYMHHECWVIGVSLLQFLHCECRDAGLSLPQYIHHEHWVTGLSLPWLPMHWEYCITGLSVT